MTSVPHTVAAVAFSCAGILLSFIIGFRLAFRALDDERLRTRRENIRLRADCARLRSRVGRCEEALRLQGGWLPLNGRDRSRRSDSLYHDTRVSRRRLCDMVALLESDREELQAKVKELADGEKKQGAGHTDMQGVRHGVPDMAQEVAAQEG